MDPLVLAGAAGFCGGLVAVLPILVPKARAALRQAWLNRAAIPGAWKWPKDAPGVFVLKGTPAWVAWAKARGEDPKTMRTWPDKRGDGWGFPSEWPVDPRHRDRAA